MTDYKTAINCIDYRLEHENLSALECEELAIKKRELTKLLNESVSHLSGKAVKAIHDKLENYTPKPAPFTYKDGTTVLVRKVEDKFYLYTRVYNSFRLHSMYNDIDSLASTMVSESWRG